jgi:hypothetical protein
LKTIILNPVSDKRWLEFVEKRKDSTIFHHPSWLNVLQKQYKFKPIAFCIEDDSHKISAGISFCEVTSITGSKKWISLPFSDHCRVLAVSEDELVSLSGFIINESVKNKIKNIEIRSALPESTGFKQKPAAYIHILKLDDSIDKILDSFNKSRTMRGIKKSQKEGVDYSISRTAGDIDNFYRLHIKTRKKIGIPVQPKKFFTNLFSEIIEKNLGYISIVKKNSVPLAAGIFAGAGATMTYKYGASDPEMLRLKPNHLMFMGAIIESHKESFQYFDFGKTDFDNEGLREFKSGWGTTEENLSYSYYPAVPENNVLDIFKGSFLSFIIKKSPAFVCRLIGELFYKYAV